MHVHVHAYTHTHTHATGDKPRLQDLDLLKSRDGREVRIVENVVAKWEKLAIRFGFEGTRISSIKRGAFFQPEDACFKMFIRWLNGEHDLKPPTWYNLIRCLEETNEFLSLARDIKEAILLKRGTGLWCDCMCTVLLKHQQLVG